MVADTRKKKKKVKIKSEKLTYKKETVKIIYSEI